MPIYLSSLCTLISEIQINGWNILNKTVNDFSLWRLIEYPGVTQILQAEQGSVVLDIGSGTSSYPLMLAQQGATEQELGWLAERWVALDARASKRLVRFTCLMFLWLALFAIFVPGLVRFLMR